MYPQGSYKGMGDIPFLNPYDMVDVASLYNFNNPASTALAAQSLVGNYDAQGTSSDSKKSVAGTQGFNVNKYVLDNQGTLALAALAIIVLATVKK